MGVPKTVELKSGTPTVGAHARFRLDSRKDRSPFGATRRRILSLCGGVSPVERPNDVSLWKEFR